MQKVKILIVEDELLIATSLKLMLQDLGYEVPAVFRSGKEFLASFKEDMADMIMMDINLADNTNGIETSKTLSRYSNIPIIYITNNLDEKIRKKAIQETNARYYIHKPFQPNDICSAIELTLKFLKGEHLTVAKSNEASYLHQDSIFIKHGYSFKKIKLSEILFFKADGSYCDLYCKDSHFSFSENLSFFEQKLHFVPELVRVHRSYIVNLNHIDKIHENRLWIRDEEIPVGKTYKSIFEKFNFI